MKFLNAGKKLVNLIANILFQKELIEVNDVGFKTVHQVAKFHSLENWLYYAYANRLINVEKESIIKINKDHQQAVIKAAFQDSELELITKSFEKNGIKHLVLKGSVLKYLYPSLDMRSMADLDILIDKKQLKSAKKIMISLGYTINRLGGNHDIYYKKPYMNIELHREMIDESYMMSKYYKNIWDTVKLIPGKNYSYQLSDDDFYIYMIAHTAKHYGHGGTGIRSLIDIWVYLLKKNDALNWEYINNEFIILGIDTFANNIKELATVWFSDKEYNEISTLMEEYIICSGTYGTTENAHISKGFINDDDVHKLRMKKWRYLLRNIFPPYRIMKKTYPKLKYFPLLLPFFWLLRIIKAILKKEHSIKTRIQGITKITSEDIEKMKELKEKTGM